MAELKELIPYSSTLSLLYIDEDRELLIKVTEALKKVFFKVDDAEDATMGLAYAKINKYDLIIVDSSSSIMDVTQLIKNLKAVNSFQNIIVTAKKLTNEQILDIYKLSIGAIVDKPLKVSLLLDAILKTVSKLLYDRSYSEDKLKKMNEELLYERKRIGRFMLNEKKLSEQIKSMQNNIDANKDTYELTKLPSKHLLQKALDGAKKSLLYINIDNFDFINSIYGMGKANKLLKECANRLSKYLPSNAKLFHITADEFVILIHEPSKQQDMILAQQIQSFFKEAAVEFEGYKHFVVFSIGIDTGEGKTLFVNAKSASKESRFFGGNQITVYSPVSEYMKEQKENLYWVETLKKAFEEDKIFTSYQPIISKNDQSIKHYEVLCRLMDGKGNLVDANKFIKSAKHLGLITYLTKIVIDKTFKLFAKNDYSFSLNISMYDLRENYLLKFLKYKCLKYNIATDRVHLEITEDVVLMKSEHIDKQISELREMGIHIIIDNFGSDTFVYNRIYELKPEFIKIDGSIIKEMNTNVIYKIIVQNIIDFSKKSGIKTIAEHVESQKVYELVGELGIDYIQGHLLGKPSPGLS